MAASVEMGPEGGSAPAGGGLDELIRALAKYSTALEQVAARLGGGTPNTSAPAMSASPREGGASQQERSQAFQSIAEWFKANAPKASKLASALAVKPRATERVASMPTLTPQQPIIKTPAPSVTNRPESPENPGILSAVRNRLVEFASTIASRLGVRTPAAATVPVPEQSPSPIPPPTPANPETLANSGGLLADLMRQLVEIAQGIAKKMVVAAPAAPAFKPSTQPVPTPSQTPEATPPLADSGGLLADLMRQLIEIAQGIARKMGVTVPASEVKASAQPAPAADQTPKTAPPLAIKAPKTAGKSTPAVAGGGMAGMAGAAVGGLATGLGAALAAPVAFAEVVSGVASKITGFVAAINPGLVQTLGLAFRDLTAVVGIALQPILQAVVPVIKQFTNALYPLAKTIGKVLSEVFEALQPAIDAITDTFYTMSETLQPVVQLIGDALKFLAPVFALLANVVKQVYIAFGAMVAAVVGVIRGLFGAVDGNGFKDVMQGLQDGLKLLTAALIRGLGYLLKFFGSISGLNGMINFLKGMNKPKENAQGIAAAQNAQFTSIEQLGKSAALASVIATATPGGAAKENKTDQDYFAGMIEELEGIKENGPDLIKVVEALPGQINEYLVKLPAQIGRHVADAINSASKEAPSAAANLANPLPMGSMASWLIGGSSASFITKPGG